MIKFITLLTFSFSLYSAANAQNRDDRHHDNDYNQNYDYNPYQDPGYYPNDNRRCETPPPPPCANRPIFVPPSYCAPVIINPYPVACYSPRNYYRPYYNKRQYSNGHRYGRYRGRY